MGDTLAMTAPVFLADTEALAQGFADGTLAEGETGDFSILSALRTGLEEKNFRLEELGEMVKAYTTALADGDGEKIGRLGPAIAAKIRRDAFVLRQMLPGIRFEATRVRHGLFLETRRSLALAVQALRRTNSQGEPEVEYPGRYAIERRIGTGAQAVVYLVFDKVTKRKVVMKVFHAGTYVERLKLFQRELKVLGRLRHPSIPKIIDEGQNFHLAIGEAERLFDDPFLVMEYAGEESLGKGQVFSWTRVQDILLQAASALETMHNAGFVYRDLKPMHVFLAKESDHERIFLIDFGIVFNTKDKRQMEDEEGRGFGTWEYASPEQIECLRPDARVDVYGMGVLMFVLLTGKLPFEGTLREILNKHLRSPVPFLRVVRPDLKFSPCLQAIIEKAMAKNPDDRFQTMAEMAKAIEACK